MPLLFCRKWRCWSRFAPRDGTLLCIRSLFFTASSLTITFPRINGDLLHHPRHFRAANLPSTRHLHSSRASRVFQSNHNSRHHSARPAESESDGVQEVFCSRRLARSGPWLGRSPGKDIHKMVSTSAHSLLLT